MCRDAIWIKKSRRIQDDSSRLSFRLVLGRRKMWESVNKKEEFMSVLDDFINTDDGSDWDFDDED